MSTLNTDQPLVNFSNCHVGIVSQLERLGELPALLAPADLARKTAQRALEFFPKAVYEHHAEEEKELFPAVLASAQVGVERMRVEALVNNLISQHRRLEHLWESLVSDLKKVAKGQDHQLNTAALQRFGHHLPSTRHAWKKKSSCPCQKKSWVATATTWRLWVYRCICVIGLTFRHTSDKRNP